MPSDTQVVTFRATRQHLNFLDRVKQVRGLKTRSDAIIYVLEQAMAANHIEPPEDTALQVPIEENPIIKLKLESAARPSIISSAQKLVMRAQQVAYGDIGEGPMYIKKTAKRLMDELEANATLYPKDAAVKLYTILKDLHDRDHTREDPKLYEKMLRELSVLEVPA